ncbi:hypothetical protein [Aromatoleum aromaticum]|uniref:hypothetical protein n=1 Tax=Aromatoleum aromaticum TaxID=551760 RepID=UPI0005A13CE4|nr:hypothetical protein [Aromatoleum aromaticum]
MEEHLVCAADNVGEFNARLRTELPEFHAFAKALHQRGLIDGLGGARIGPVGSLEQRGVAPVLSAAAETRMADVEWARNKGSGPR